MNTVVTQGVELGYRVIEEQIRQGQRVAEQINRRTYDRAAIGNDLREVAERTVRYYADLAALWFDLLGSLFGNTDRLRSLLAPGPSNSVPSSAAASASGPTGVTIEVLSSRPTRVTLDLRPHSNGLRLFAQDLRALESATPSLTDVTFEPAPDGGFVSLRIRVPDGQPPGIYSGAVIDRDTGQPRGTLSVRLAGPPGAGVRLP